VSGLAAIVSDGKRAVGIGLHGARERTLKRAGGRDADRGDYQNCHVKLLLRECRRLTALVGENGLALFGQGPGRWRDLLDDELDLVAAVGMSSGVVVGEVAHPVAVGRERVLDLAQQARRRVKPVVIAVPFGLQLAPLLIEKLVRQDADDKPADLTTRCQSRNACTGSATCSRRWLEYRVDAAVGKGQGRSVIARIISLDTDRPFDGRHCAAADIEDHRAGQIAREEPAGMTVPQQRPTVQRTVMCYNL
jgi:hypothetical protein